MPKGISTITTAAEVLMENVEGAVFFTSKTITRKMYKDFLFAESTNISSLFTSQEINLNCKKSELKIKRGCVPSLSLHFHSFCFFESFLVFLSIAWWCQPTSLTYSMEYTYQLSLYFFYWIHSSQKSFFLCGGTSWHFFFLGQRFSYVSPQKEKNFYIVNL